MNPTCDFLLNILLTRQSSCVNARGILTTAYQVLHLLPSTGGGTPAWSDRGFPLQVVPHPFQGSTPGSPHLDLAGVPSHCQGWGTTHRGNPLSDTVGGTPVRPGWGTPQQGYPPCGQTDGQIRVKT